MACSLSARAPRIMRSLLRSECIMMPQLAERLPLNAERLPLNASCPIQTLQLYILAVTLSNAHTAWLSDHFFFLPFLPFLVPLSCGGGAGSSE